MKTLLVAVKAYLLPLVVVNAYLPPLVLVNGQKRSVGLYQGVYSFTKELNKTQKQCNNDTFSWTKMFFLQFPRDIKASTILAYGIDFLGEG